MRGIVAIKSMSHYDLQVESSLVHGKVHMIIPWLLEAHRDDRDVQVRCFELGTLNNCWVMRSAYL